MSRSRDIAVIGGGIVGLAAAVQAAERFPDHRVVVLEKEAAVACHQSGNNSGVLHTGIYYRPGSLKAVNCRAGKAAMEAFCERESIPYVICGKVIVALSDGELPALRTILDRGRENGVRCELIDRARLREIEPHAAGIGAIHVPEAGIVDFRAVSRRLAEKLIECGGEVRLNTTVKGFRRNADGVTVETSGNETLAAHVINCAGLYSDRIGAMTGAQPDLQIIPFRGEYYELKPEAHHLCSSLIYPVPDPGFPFLGVHFTRMIQGGVECGPNAVLAFSREGYSKTCVAPRDLLETLTYPGFLRLAARHWRAGAGEMWRSLSKGAFVRALQRLVPEIRPDHLVAAPAGVRAQAVDRAGRLVDDFAIESGRGITHVYNAPSPAATASLAIGRFITDRVAEQLA
jgi:(S)-2-hydroxyglutarate dehydrogenase